jgi:hypothetical protein
MGAKVRIVGGLWFSVGRDFGTLCDAYSFSGFAKLALCEAIALRSWRSAKLIASQFYFIAFSNYHHYANFKLHSKT